MLLFLPRPILFLVSFFPSAEPAADTGHQLPRPQSLQTGRPARHGIGQAVPGGKAGDQPPHEAVPRPGGFERGDGINAGACFGVANTGDSPQRAHLVDGEGSGAAGQVARGLWPRLVAAGQQGKFIVIADDDIRQRRSLRAGFRGEGGRGPGIGAVVDVEDHRHACSAGAGL